MNSVSARSPSALHLTRAPKPFTCASEVAAVVGWVPPTEVLSEELERELGLTPGLLERFAGVRARRVVAPGTTVMAMALEACQALQRRHPFDVESVDVVIFAGVSRDYLEPATAAMVAKQLGMVRATAFDMSSACLGFIDAWMTADAMIQLGRAKTVLIVAAERSGTLQRDAIRRIKAGEPAIPLIACFTLGDGAAAMLLRAPTASGGHLAAVSGLRLNFNEHSELCTLRDLDTAMNTDAKGLFAAALEHGPPMVTQMLGVMGWAPSEVDVVIPHQASLRSIQQGARRMGFSVAQGHVTLNRLGNLASVAVPLTLADALEGRAQLPQKVMVLGYGSGLGVGVLALSVQ